MNRALGKIGVALIVRHHADRCATAMELAQEFHHCLAVFRVQVSGRLVSHQNQRIAHQRPCYCHALLLTAGELRRVVPHAVRHSHALECLLDLLLALRRTGASIGQWQLDVFVHGEVANQVERLKDEADLPVADARAIADREIRHRLAVQRVVPVRWRIQQAENREQRRFAAARWPGDRDVLSLLDFEMNLGKRVRFHLIGVEHFLHAFQLDERAIGCGHFLSFS